MDNEKFEELLQPHTSADLAKTQARITILFSDIKGSTEYFEKKGDVEGLAMVQRHNALVIPVIEQNGGRVVKTIGDAIMASFNDQVRAVNAAIDMQRVLEADREERSEGEHIYIRIGMHTGLGLIQDNDIFGDVVNAASRVERQAEAGQILITEVLLDAAREAGAQWVKLGRSQMKGKDELIELYAIAWSTSAHEQLFEEVHAQFERKLRDAKRQHVLLEEELEASREQWRTERRRMAAEIEHLEESIESARESAKEEAAEDLQSEIRFELEAALQRRQVAEQELAAAQEKWEAERRNLKAQIISMQGAVIEAIELSNNPTRLALAVREQVEARLRDAKQDWALEFEGERRRLNAEIERLKKVSGLADEKRDAARRALLERLGKAPAGQGPAAKTADEIGAEFDKARIAWDMERDQLKLKIQRLERDLQVGKDQVRADAFLELRTEYEPKIAAVNNERQRLERELERMAEEFEVERARAAERARQLEDAVPQAQAAVRKQVAAELKAEFEARIEELSRLKSRNEQRYQTEADEAEAERRRLKKQVADLEQELQEAKDAAFRAQRQGGPLNKSMKAE